MNEKMRAPTAAATTNPCRVRLDAVNMANSSLFTMLTSAQPSTHHSPPATVNRLSCPPWPTTSMLS